MNKKVRVEYKGIVPYDISWKYQESLLQKIVAIKILNRQNNLDLETTNYLLFTEHPHSYTLGTNGDINNLLLDVESLKRKGILFYKTNRGGDITYHGPGQLVVYPILDLENFFTDIHRYLRLLEEVIILTLLEYGLKGERIEKETGVWIEAHTPYARKICALGVRTSRWVSMHGFAFNINTDLDFFQGIIPCGIRGKKVTSIKEEIKKEIEIREVEKKVLKHLKNIFGFELLIETNSTPPRI